MFATHDLMKNHPKFMKIPLSIQFFSKFFANVLSTTSYQSIVTNANILVQFVWKWQAEKDPLKKVEEKLTMTKKTRFFQCFAVLQLFSTLF